MPDQLPRGWVATTLGEIVSPSRARVQPDDAPGLPYVGMEHVQAETMTLIGHGDSTNLKSSSLRFESGDVLYGKMRPYLNKVWVAEFEGLCSAEFLVFPKTAGLNSKFLAYRVNSPDFVEFASRQVSGERPRVDFSKLARFTVLLPPSSEQDRIVGKLDALLSRVAAGKSAARRALERLERYRATVQQQAVSGELTRAWREIHPSEETGKHLLGRLLPQRPRRWEEAGRLRLHSAESQRTEDSWREGDSEQSLPDTDDMPRLPESWAWARLDELADIGTGIAVSQHRLISDSVTLPYLRVANVLRGKLDLSEIKTIRVPRNQRESRLLQSGDILFTEGGDRDKLGRGWIWEEQIPECTHQNHVFRARLIDRTLLDPKLVSHWGNSFGQRFFMHHATQTTNLASINKRVLAQLPIPVIPVAEQQVIIRELDRRLTAADRLAATLASQLDRAQKARESLLGEAVNGQLVGQDQSETPAHAVLERIRSNRDQQTKARRRKRMAKSKPPPETLKLIDLIKKHFGRSPFTFEALRREVHPSEYDDLRNSLYELLRPGTNGALPLIRMSFDAGNEVMKFTLGEK